MSIFDMNTRELPAAKMQQFGYEYWNVSTEIFRFEILFYTFYPSKKKEREKYSIPFMNLVSSSSIFLQYFCLYAFRYSPGPCDILYKELYNFLIFIFLSRQRDQNNLSFVLARLGNKSILIGNALHVD